MASDEDVRKRLSMVSEIRMSPQKEKAIWLAIEQRMNPSPPPGRRRGRFETWPSLVAATAAVACLVGGVYAVSHRQAPHGTQAENTTASAQHVLSFPAPSSIQSISVETGPGFMLWHAASPQRVATQVLSWLNRASLFLGDIPASDRSIVLQGNIGPAQLRMVTVNHQTMTLCPTSYLVQVSAHQVQIRYVQDVVTCVSGDQTVYLKAPQLFHWLKDGDWEGEFTQAHS